MGTPDFAAVPPPPPTLLSLTPLAPVHDSQNNGIVHVHVYKDAPPPSVASNRLKHKAMSNLSNPLYSPTPPASPAPLARVVRVGRTACRDWPHAATATATFFKEVGGALAAWGQP